MAGPRAGATAAIEAARRFAPGPSAEVGYGV